MEIEAALTAGKPHVEIYGDVGGKKSDSKFVDARLGVPVYRLVFGDAKQYNTKSNHARAVRRRLRLDNEYPPLYAERLAQQQQLANTSAPLNRCVECRLVL